MSDDVFSGARKGEEYARMIGRVIGYLFFVFTRPLSLISQGLFRRHFGERYFTPLHAMGGCFLIGLATTACIMVPASSLVRPGTAGLGMLSLGGGETVQALIVGGLWLLVFLLVGAEQTKLVRERHVKSTRWHSRNMGVPRSPALTNGSQYALTMGMAVVFWLLGLPGLALLAVFSMSHSATADAYAAAAFYNEVLDRIDGQIEGENLAKAVEARLSPLQAQGLLVTLPRSMSDKTRRDIVEMFGGGVASVPADQGGPTAGVPPGHVVEPKPDQPLQAGVPEAGWSSDGPHDPR